MALIMRGKTQCALCERVLSEGDDIVATSHFIGDPYDRLWRYSDAGMHRACLLAWDDRTAFIARYNSIFGPMVWGNGMSDRMEEDGRITRHPADRQSTKPPEEAGDGNAAAGRHPATDRVARRLPLSERRPRVYVGSIEPR